MTADNSFKHIVFTRYFVRFSDAPADVEMIRTGGQGWLDERFRIFERFCFPSVVAQSVQNFLWLIYFDEQTPAHQIDRVRALVAGHHNIKIVTCDRFEDAARDGLIRAALGSETRWLLTTRLDNDDGWARDFVKTLQENLRFNGREFLNFPVGVIYYDDKTFLYRHDSNAFISCLEPVEGYLTVWCAPHVRLGRIAPVVQLPPRPAFMQVVHGGTRSNKPRGVRVHRLLALDGFEAIADPTAGPQEKDWDIVFYNLGVALVWRLRDLTVDAVRGLLGRSLPGAAK